MIPRILEHLDRGRQDFSWSELCLGLVPAATVLRWRARAHAGLPLLEPPGPKKPEPFDPETIRQKIAQLGHGRRRTAGTTALYTQWSDAISRRRFQELVAEERQHHFDQLKRIEWHLPGAVWSIDTTEYGPEKIKITPVRDLAAHYQLPAPLVELREEGVRIADYLDRLFQREGPPMFLKRDLGSPLTCHAVDAVLERHGVLPLNSPPGYPQYNGAMERSMYDLHEALDQRRGTAPPLPLTADVELVTHQLNHRRLRSLGNRTPCQVFYDPAGRLQLHGASRQKIFREVFEQFWQCLETMPDRSRHQTTAVWRWVVETWLRRQGWITVRDKPQPNVSTNFEPFFSHN